MKLISIVAITAALLFCALPGSSSTSEVTTVQEESNTMKITKEYIPMVHREEPVLEALDVRPSGPPATELVYFT